MKMILPLFLLFNQLPTFAEEQNCEILAPNALDKNGQFCHGTYGITYKGVLASTFCFSSSDKAQKALSKIQSCKKDLQLNHCKILLLGQKDKKGEALTNSFGVTYKGYLYSSNKSYFQTLDGAMTEMENLSICGQEDKVGNLKILYPYQIDKNGESCGGFFSITREDQKVGKRCYYNAVDATEAMNKLSHEP